MSFTFRVYRVEPLPERWEPDGYNMRHVIPIQLIAEDYDHTDEHRDEAEMSARSHAETLAYTRRGSYTFLEIINP